jgi:glycosyltransferase involved in cell wall biosynthesis
VTVITEADRQVLQYSVVIPVYNSAPIVGTTIEQARLFFERRHLSYEIIAVDDGSRDGSWDVLRRVARSGGTVTAIGLAANRGQHTATLCGLAHARGGSVVTLDDDLQHPPEEIARLIEKAEEGHDLVCGRFLQGRGHVRRMASLTVGGLDRALFHKPRGFVFTSFRLMRRDVVDRLCNYRLPDPYLRGLLVRCATSPANAWVEHRPRTVGRSGYNAVTVARFGARILRTCWDLHRPQTPTAPLAWDICEVVRPGRALDEAVATQ